MTVESEHKSPDWHAMLADAMEALDCQTGSLHFTDESGDHLTLAAQIGIPSSLLSVIARIPFGKGIAGAAAMRCEPVELCNLQTDESGVARPGARATGVAGSLAIPILQIGGTGVIGTLGVGKQEPHVFSEEEKQTLQKLGEDIARVFNGGR